MSNPEKPKRARTRARRVRRRFPRLLEPPRPGLMPVGAAGCPAARRRWLRPEKTAPRTRPGRPPGVDHATGSPPNSGRTGPVRRRPAHRPARPRMGKGTRLRGAGVTMTGSHGSPPTARPRRGRGPVGRSLVVCPIDDRNSPSAHPDRAHLLIHPVTIYTGRIFILIDPNTSEPGPGFGVGRGFAIRGPFPVQAPDKAPETCTWSTRSADRGSQVSALGVGLPSGTPFRCKHRIKHRKRAPGQRGLRVGANLLSRNLDGNQIAWKYRRCAGHANLLLRDGVKRQVGKCDCLLEFTTRPELSQSRARIWPQQHVPKRLKNSATRNSRARSQNRRLAICMA